MDDFVPLYLTSLGVILRVYVQLIFMYLVLSRNENDMGQFLREQGEMDKTSAGKMMIAVGKAQCFTSQQRYGYVFGNLLNSCKKCKHGNSVAI